MYIILVYDILTEDNGPKISRNVFKICKKYLTNVQKSVFEGEITPVLLKKLNLELKRHIRKDKDSLIIFKSRQEKWLEILGNRGRQNFKFFLTAIDYNKMRQI